MADYIKRYVDCPFYQSNRRNDKLGYFVKCEGGTLLVFPDKQTEAGHLDQFCCGRWKECSVAIFLNKYYERQVKSNQ